ncbi:hypothetical protein RA210_U10635 [Rubrivivax sp. A210]|nr:hypothetical protein RA210_U10635 [Rubrivivax sp. A210]
MHGGLTLLVRQRRFITTIGEERARTPFSTKGRSPSPQFDGKFLARDGGRVIAAGAVPHAWHWRCCASGALEAWRRLVDPTVAARRAQ